MQLPEFNAEVVLVVTEGNSRVLDQRRSVYCSVVIGGNINSEKS